MANSMRPRTFPGTWPLLCCAVLLFAFTLLRADASAQQPSGDTSSSLQSTSDLVAVDVSVLDRNGNFYGGLGRSNFRVLDNGIEKPLQFFSPIEAPARVAVLIETGPAVFLIHEEHISALASLLNGLAPDDQAALFTYSDLARQIVPFTTNKALLGESVGETQYTVGMDQLNFYDSLGAVVEALPPGKDAIVVLSTGLDSGPPDHWNVLENKLRASNVVVFPVALGGALRGTDSAPENKKKNKKKSGQSTQDSTETPAFARADEALRSLARITGGKAYFPQSPADFASAYREIASAVRHQYVLGIAPGHDGSFHKLSIDVLNERGQTANRGQKSSQYRAFFREGYSAPAQ